MALTAVLLFGCSAGPIQPHGPGAGRLAPCPASPNCVTSRDAGDPSHAVAPLPYGGSAEEARERLLAVVGSLPRAKVIISDKDYIHATFTSRIFRFVDDVEFLFDDAVKVIHVRSASRVGHSDFGVNRRRIETIRTLFSKP